MKETSKRPHIKAAARDATGVSTVRGGRRFCAFAGCQQLAEGAPVSGMPLGSELFLFGLHSVTMPSRDYKKIVFRRLTEVSPDVVI